MNVTEDRQLLSRDDFEERDYHDHASYAPTPLLVFDSPHSRSRAASPASSPASLAHLRASPNASHLALNIESVLSASPRSASERDTASTASSSPSCLNTPTSPMSGPIDASLVPLPVTPTLDDIDSGSEDAEGDAREEDVGGLGDDELMPHGWDTTIQGGDNEGVLVAEATAAAQLASPPQEAHLIPLPLSPGLGEGSDLETAAVTLTTAMLSNVDTSNGVEATNDEVHRQ